MKKKKDVDKYRIASQRTRGLSKSGKLRCQMLQRIKDAGQNLQMCEEQKAELGECRIEKVYLKWLCRENRDMAGTESKRE